MPVQSSLGQSGQNRPMRIFLFLSVLIAIAVVACSPSDSNNVLTPTPTPTGIGIINKPNNERIGLSDGTYAFDVSADRPDACLNMQASAKLAKGDKVGAMSLWNQAIGKNGNDTSDAEALIYLEDQLILASGSPYITLVVGTMLTGNESQISAGRDNLQGAYV